MAGWQILTFSNVSLFLGCIRANDQHLMQESSVNISASLEYSSLNILKFVLLGAVFIMQLRAELISF